MNNLTEIVIVIPIYRDFLDDFEKKSLESIIKNYNDFEVIFVAPQEMSVSNYSTFFNQLNTYKIQYFDANCFASIDAYNKLLLDYKFYKSFENYNYILICQLDAYVFKNDLINWCNKGFDYVGSPWVGSERNFINQSFEKINNFFRTIKGKQTKNTARLFKVGNGGFSLRNVQKFIHISKEQSENIHSFLATKPETEYHIEDVFWSLYVPTIYKDFKIPDWKTALDFCIDRKPELSLKYNDNRQPMACHGFNKRKVEQFWKKYIK